MKIISKEDLLVLISKGSNHYSLDDLEALLNRYGDDYFTEGGVWEKTKENKEMALIRKESESAESVCLNTELYVMNLLLSGRFETTREIIDHMNAIKKVNVRRMNDVC